MLLASRSGSDFADAECTGWMRDRGSRQDHELWLHPPFRADEWLLYAQDSPNLHGSPGFSRGLIFARDRTLVASVAQVGCCESGDNGVTRRGGLPLRLAGEGLG